MGSKRYQADLSLGKTILEEVTEGKSLFTQFGP
jgi:hypothetical protein